MNDAANAPSELAWFVCFGHSSTVPPTDLLREVRVLNVAFRGYQQQDAQEFLRFFLDRLHEDLSQAVPARVEPGAAAAAAGGAAPNGVPATTAAISASRPDGPAAATAATSGGGGSGNARHLPFSFGGKKKKSKSGRSAEAIAEQTGPTDAAAGAFSAANGGGGGSAEDADGDDGVFVSRRPRGVPNRKGEPQASVISDTFAGVLESHVVCRHCDKVRRPPPFSRIPVRTLRLTHRRR